MYDLSITLFGITFKNPVWTASGTFGYGLEAMELVDFLYLQVSPESFWIEGSRQEVLIPAGWMEKQGYLNKFGT
jgi:hypothetical protein